MRIQCQDSLYPWKDLNEMHSPEHQLTTTLEVHSVAFIQEIKSFLDTVTAALVDSLFC